MSEEVHVSWDNWMMRKQQPYKDTGEKSFKQKKHINIHWVFIAYQE